jgi:hypothetical protein
VLYSVSLAGFEQFVLIKTSALPPPEDFGLDSSSTVLQVLTELAECKLASVSEGASVESSGVDLANEAIGMDGMFFGNGAAFRFGAAGVESALPMGKEIAIMDNRRFLVEEAPAAGIIKELKSLQWEGGVIPSVSSKIKRTAALDRQIPRAPSPKGKKQPMELAKAGWTPRGVALDYTVLNSGYANYTLKSSETYYISAAVTFSGVTTWEPGSVTKVLEQPTAKITLNGPANCAGLPYQPVVLTSANDNTAGQNISGSTGNPNNTNSPIYLEWTVSQTNPVTYLHARFANTALKAPGFTQGISHSQFVRCGTAMQVTASNPLALRNVLIASGTNCVSTASSVAAEHLTLDQCASFCPISYSGASLTNSILTAITSTTGVTAYNSASYSSGASVYQTMAAGNYYLASQSTNRMAGTTNINAKLSADLRNLTTYPPLWLTNTITVDTVLGPVVSRGQTVPDRGYYYDPVDYCASNVTVTNCTLLLTNGVAVAGVNSGAFKFRSGKFISQGSPVQLNRLTRYETVQEQPLLLGATDATFLQVVSGTPEVRLRITDVSFLGGGTTRRFLLAYNNAVNPWEFSHCQLRGIHVNEYDNSALGINLRWTNNIFYGCTVSLYQQSPGYYTFGAELRNNLFYRGTLDLQDVSSAGTWTAKDNLFDCLTLTKTGVVAADYNGYRTGLSSIGGANNKTGLTMDYQGGPATNFFGVLGSFYYPATGGSLTQLINAGSRTAAAASLYHFTTVPAQTKESTSQVDIGYHLVALDGNGNPVDTDGDSIPDYLEDANGNGTVDSGETDWTSATDFGLSVRILRPASNSPLP